MDSDLPADSRVVVLRRFHAGGWDVSPRLRGRTTYDVVPYRWWKPRHWWLRFNNWRFERRFGRG